MTVKELKRFLEYCEDKDDVTLVVDAGDNPNGCQYGVEKILRIESSKGDSWICLFPE